MAKDTENKKSDATIRGSNKDFIKSLAWLVEAVFRGFVGWVLLTNFHNYFAIAAAVYALITGGIIVAAHFVKAHKG